MRLFFQRPAWWSLLSFTMWLVLASLVARAQEGAEEIRVVQLEGTMEIFTAGGNRWVFTQTNQVVRAGDRLRTSANSRAGLSWPDASVYRMKGLTEVAILPPEAKATEPGLHIFRGILSFFHRGSPGHSQIRTKAVSAGIKGTEFVIAVEFVAGVERTTLSVIDGEVSFTNEFDALTLTNNQQAFAEQGRGPVRAPGFVANNILQWAFYYPGVLDTRDLALTPDEKTALGESLAAYQSGDLPAALAAYGAREPASESDRLYRAALLLSVGEVEQSSDALIQVEQANTSERGRRLAAALRQLIAAVKFEPIASVIEPTLTTELMTASYYQQSRAGGDETLKQALALARRAATTVPEFGFASARLAELEFSFGRVAQAKDVLKRSLVVSPRNAQAVALQGFLLAAENKPREAIDWFDRAIGIDGALANAWLGRGLCRIRRGELVGGREDLLVAAAIEPRRAQLRSYLGKAYGDAGEPVRALHESDLAKEIDPNDPSVWFLSALLKASQSRVNESIREMEKAQELNNNRQLLRSEYLLDQDRAVRSVNLARVYADNDMGEVAVHEAGHATALDYANYSAHSFLANSYEAERRANGSNLRFEELAFSEYLMANLLGPAQGRLLAQPVTQLEYSGLFERNRLGLIANAEYFSRGAWHFSGAQYGTLNGSGYSVEAEYRTEPGERPNQDFEVRQLEAKFKHDLTPEDSVYFHVIDYRAEGGDVAQHFDEQEVSRTARFEKTQTPTILAGYHHQWSPQSHTLFLAGWLEDHFESRNTLAVVPVLDRFQGTPIALAPVIVDEAYQSRVDLFTAELQQITVLGNHSLVAGARGQWGQQTVDSRVQNPNGDNLILLGTNNPVSLQREDVWTSSATVYAYDYLQLVDTLQLVAGLDLTYQSIPRNTATSPVSSEKDYQNRLGPKGAIIWSPFSSSSFRVSYAESLTGSGPGQSIRLQPTQLAGMPQTFRDPAPPSIVGSLDGADLDTLELLWEGRFHDTFLSLGGQFLAAERNRYQGLFLSHPDYDPPPTLGLIREHIRFREQALGLSAHQLLGNEWSFGLRYRLSYAQLKRSYPEYPGFGVDSIDDQTDWRGWLHTLNLSGLYRHKSGFFAQVEGVLFVQEREREDASQPGENFWEVNLLAGYRFPRQKAEIAVGVVNLLDNDYRLDPINHYPEQPRTRSLYVRLNINF